MSVPIVVDYREKKPYEFPGIDKVKEEQLHVGDYTLEGFEYNFAVERKTLDDLASSVGTDRLRFENEIRRANGFANRNENNNPIPGTKPEQALDEFIVVIEGRESQVYDYAGRKRSPHYYSKIYPNAIIGTIEKWPEKYDTLEFVWAGSREGGKQETLRQLDKWYINHS
jgi:hypothetical protein